MHSCYTKVLWRQFSKKGKHFIKKIFWENPYQTSLETEIIVVNGNTIACAETIAYSFAGGQESDKAWINNIPILDSRMDGNLIYYTMPDDHGLLCGDTVTMTIDWQRRLRLMRLHFAAELVLEIVTRNYRYEKIGAHIAEHKARIDFKADANISNHFPQILEHYNAIIAMNMPIEKGYSDIENQRRYWKIEGFAQVSCGGTHVNSTAEVGYITLKREKPGKGIERIEIKLVQ